MNERNVYAMELSENERVLFGRVKSTKKRGKKYESALKSAVQVVLDSEVVTADGIAFTVAEKIAIGVVKDAMEKPTIDKAIGLAKITGEYSEKVEANLSGMESIINTIKGESKF